MKTPAVIQARPLRKVREVKRHNKRVSDTHIVRSQVDPPARPPALYPARSSPLPTIVILADPVVPAFPLLPALIRHPSPLQPLLTLPARTPTLIPIRRLPPIPELAWHTAAVSDAHAVCSHTLPPARPRPLTSTGSAAAGGPAARGRGANARTRPAAAAGSAARHEPHTVITAVRRDFRRPGKERRPRHAVQTRTRACWLNQRAQAALGRISLSSVRFADPCQLLSESPSGRAQMRARIRESGAGSRGPREDSEEPPLGPAPRRARRRNDSDREPRGSRRSGVGEREAARGAARGGRRGRREVEREGRACGCVGVWVVGGRGGEGRTRR